MHAILERICNDVATSSVLYLYLYLCVGGVIVSALPRRGPSFDAVATLKDNTRRKLPGIAQNLHLLLLLSTKACESERI